MLHEGGKKHLKKGLPENTFYSDEKNQCPVTRK